MMKIEKQQSIMMNKVLAELKNMISTIVVKLDFVAERYETLETLQAGDLYVACAKGENTFDSHKNFSMYSLFESGLAKDPLDAERYMKDKYLIPYEYRERVLIAERKYIIANYEERNNYYRTLSGLPELGDKDKIYITEVSDDIDGVDSSKPISEMTDDEISILEVSGVIDKLCEAHPEKKYITHLHPNRRISVIDARTAVDYSILYLYTDRGKQPITEMFINIYNNTKEYVLDRFYDDAFEKFNEYYKGFIGMFILSITIQRFITNYFKKFINRDFYDKDIIRLLFESYGIPFYNDIPLSYLQKVAKNLNRLLMFKAEDQVFTDIFKIFDLDNTEICNYILMKNPILDNDKKPILLYKEKNDILYYQQTTTYSIKATEDFYGSLKLDFDNIKQIIKLGENDCILYNNNILKYDNKEYNNIEYAVKAKNHVFALNENLADLMVINNIGKIKNINLRTLLEEGMEDDEIIGVIFKIENTKDNNNLMIINLEKSGSMTFLFDAETLEATKLYKSRLKIDAADYKYESIVMIDEQNNLILNGNHTIAFPTDLHIDDTKFYEISDVIIDVKDIHILPTGCLFIMENGTVRYTGDLNVPTIPVINRTTDIIKNISNIKAYYNMYDNGNYLHLFLTYNGNLIRLDEPQKRNIDKILFVSDKTNISKFNYIKDIYMDDDHFLITCYVKNNKALFAGTNDGQYPFISSRSFKEYPMDRNVEFMVLYNDKLFYSTHDNKIFMYNGDEKIEVMNIQYEIQNIVVEQDIYVLLGTKKIIRIYYEDDILKFTEIDFPNIILDVIDTGYKVLFKTLNERYYDIDGNMIPLMHEFKDEDVEFKWNESKNCYTLTNSEFVDIPTNIDKQILRMKNYGNLIIIEDEENIGFIKSTDISETEAIVEKHNVLMSNTCRSEITGGDIIFYNGDRGISLLRNFKNIDKFEIDLAGDVLQVLDSENTDIIKLQQTENAVFVFFTEPTVIDYEEDVEKMYKLEFVEIPINDINKSKYLNDSQYHLDYELVTSNDALWGGNRDKKEFVKSILQEEFNYVTSKYISIKSTYDITKLNFEICYMFKMLTELKDAESQLYLDVRTVGKVRLFDTVVALFAITCKKMGLYGEILKTTTQHMSVLGFNFGLDMDYITKVVEDARLYERDPNFKKEDIEIFKNPKAFKNAAEVVNLYLDNRQIMENIYDKKFAAKTKEEWNAYKRIEQASLYSHYMPEVYTKSNGEVADTYLDYLKSESPKLYSLVNQASDEDMLEQMDYLLLALNNYLESDKFKYLFLNIPSLSLDVIRRFIYYLISIFKSYRVQMKAMNIIYHVDDKRIHNIKMILEEDAFKKSFTDWDRIKFEDFMEYTFCGFERYEKLKLRIINDETRSKFTDFEILKLVDIFADIYNANIEYKATLIKDFDDFFDEMYGFIETENEVLNLIEKVFRSVYLEKHEKINIKELLQSWSSLRDYDRITIEEFLNVITNQKISDYYDIEDISYIDSYMNDFEFMKFKDFIGVVTTAIVKNDSLADFSDMFDDMFGKMERYEKEIIYDKYLMKGTEDLIEKLIFNDLFEIQNVTCVNKDKIIMKYKSKLLGSIILKDHLKKLIQDKLSIDGILEIPNYIKIKDKLGEMKSELIYKDSLLCDFIEMISDVKVIREERKRITLVDKLEIIEE